jgi:outer membrane protein TolC
MKTADFKKASSLAFGLLVLAGCAVGPDYHRPAVATPEQWGEVQPQQASFSHMHSLAKPNDFARKMDSQRPTEQQRNL